MKKEMLALMLLPSALLCSCDPGYTTITYIENGTDHEITFKAYSPQDEHRRTWFSDDEIVIGSFSRIALDTISDIGSNCAPSDGSDCFNYYSDSILICFEDRMLTFHRDSLTKQAHSPYSAMSFHLENREHGWMYEEADAVYVITEEDYHRAK